MPKALQLLLLLLCLFVLPLQAYAQQSGQVEGRVIEAGAEEPLASANVVLLAEGFQRGTTTDLQGRFSFDDVPAGTYRLSASMLGYEESEVEIAVQPGEKTTVGDLALQETTYGMEEVTVSATRSREHLSTVPSSITVIGPEEMETQTTLTSDLGDVLAQAVPGLGQSTGTLSNYGQTLRGRDLFTLIDGVPQATPLRRGLRSLRSIDPSAIERIEVVRGASALYGYGATGGAINVVTRRAEDGPFNAAVEAGLRFSTEDVGGSLSERLQGRASGRTGSFDYLVSGSFEDWGHFFDAEGDRIPQDPQGQGGLAGADEYNFLLKGGAQLDRQQRLELTFNYYDFKQEIAFATVPGVPDSAKATTEEAGEVPGKNPGTDNLVTTLRYEHAGLLGSRLAAQVFVQDFKTRFSYYPDPIYPDGGQPFIRSEKLGARLDVETPLPLTTGSTVRWGADFLRDETAQPLEDGRIYVPPIEQTSAAPFAQLKLPFGERAVLRSGARYEALRLSVDDYTTLFGENAVEGGTLTYDAFVFNTGGVFYPTDATEVFASFSQGFSVADVGRILRSYGEGTGEEQSTSVGALRPEPQKVNSYEAGVRLNTAAASATLTGFMNTSELGVTFEGDYPDLRIARSPERIQGVEATLDVRPTERLAFGGTYTYLEGKRDSNEDGSYATFLPGTRIPPMKATGYASYAPVEGWSARLQLLYSGSRDRFEGEDAEAFGQGPVESYTTVDLQTALDLEAVGLGRGTFRLGVENLFNAFYFPPISQWYNLGSGYAAAPGRQVTLSYAVDL